MQEHYKAQSYCAELLFEADFISWFHPIKKAKAYHKCFEFLRSHEKCCEWARETIKGIKSQKGIN